MMKYLIILNLDVYFQLLEDFGFETTWNVIEDVNSFEIIEKLFIYVN